MRGQDGVNSVKRNENETGDWSILRDGSEGGEGAGGLGGGWVARTPNYSRQIKLQLLGVRGGKPSHIPIQSVHKYGNVEYLSRMQ